MRQLAQVVSKLSIKVLEGEAKSKKEAKLAKTKKPVEEDPETSSDEDSKEEEAPPTKQQVKMISQKKI